MRAVCSIMQDDDEIIENVIRAHGVKSVLEFGPGSSTELFVRSGVLIHSCEDDNWWFEKCKIQFPNVRFFRYTDEPPIEIAGLLDSYDLGFVDGPRGTKFFSRLNSMMFCTKRCKLVLVHDSKREGEMQSIKRMVDIFGVQEHHFGTKKGLCLLSHSLRSSS